jgi:hypothetical protein
LTLEARALRTPECNRFYQEGTMTELGNLKSCQFSLKISEIKWMKIVC